MNNKNTLSSQIFERLINGLLKENPTFVLLLGMCPTLAVTTSAMNGLGMGLTTLAVLALSNVMISALRKIIPSKIRIPAFIVIIASFVTIVELLLKAYIPSLYDSLGLYIPLIVVNCIILGRAEAYAYLNPVLPSLFDGLGMGMGFTIALTIIGSIREILGSGCIFGYNIMPNSFIPVSIFVMAPGAFFVLAALTAIQNVIKEKGEKRGKDMSRIQSGCGGNCIECSLECADKKLDKKKDKSETKDNDTNSSINSSDNKEKSKDIEENNEALELKESLEEKKPIEDNSVSEDKPLNEEKSQKEEKPQEEEKPQKEEKASAKEKSSKKDKALKKEKISKKEKASKADKTSKEDNFKDKENTFSEDKDTEGKKQIDSEEAEEKELLIIDDSDDFELIDLSDYKRALSENKKNKNDKPKKPVNRRASMDKAMLMLSKAEETLKEEEGDK